MPGYFPPLDPEVETLLGGDDRKDDGKPRLDPEVDAILEQEDRKKDETGRKLMLGFARKKLEESPAPGLQAAMTGASAGILAPIKRVLGDTEHADYINRMAAAYEQAAEEKAQGGAVPAFVERGFRGVGKTLPVMVAAGSVGGPYAAIAAAVAGESDQAITEGKDAGLKGAKLAGYAVSQGIVEGLPAVVMQKIGLGGAESLASGKKLIAEGVKAGLKRVGISFAQELPEELVTELGHKVASSLSGVDPEALSMDSLGKMVADTTFQTALTFGAVGTPSVLASYRQGKIATTRREITEAADSGRTPSRTEWAKWGLPAEDGASEKQRKAGAAKLAEEIRASEKPAEVEPEAAEPQPPDQIVSPEVQQPPVVEQQAPAAGQPEAEIPVSPDIPSQESTIPPPVSAPPVTSVKNEIVNELRQARGDEPVAGEDRETTVDWLERADQTIKEDPTAPDRLVKGLRENPRNISDEETAVLQIHYRRLNNSFAAQSEKLFSASESGDTVEQERAQKESNIIFDQMREVEEASKAAGREWGRAGVARQIELLADFSPAALVRRARVAKGGGPLSPEEGTKVKELSDKVTELQTRLDEQSKKKAEDEVTDAVDKTIAGFRPKRGFRKTSARKTEAHAKVSAAWEEFKSKLSIDPGTVGKFMGEEKGSVNLDLIASGAKLVRAYIDLGVATFSEFYANAKQQLGDRVESAREALLVAWNQAVNEGAISPLYANADDPKSISRAAKRIARSLVESGVTERDEVVDAVYEELRQVVPEITRRQTMDAISGYGQYAELSKDEVSIAIRDINGQLQQLAKLEDMAEGRAPKKTGVERRSPSDEERRLLQQVNEAKKRGGFNVTDPETQLKSALDAAKTAVRNRISDLEEEIRTRQKIVKQRTTLAPDAELSRLRQQRDELSKEHAEVFPKQPATPEQRIAAAGKALDRAISQLESDLKTGKIGFRKKGPPLSAPELDAKRSRLEELRQHRDELREAANPKKSPEELQTAAYKRDLLRRLADLKRRIAEGDFTKKEIKKVMLDKEATDLKFQLKEAKDQFSAMENEWKKSQRNAWEVAKDTVRETLNASRAILTSMDLSAVLRQGGFSAAAHPIIAAKAFPTMLRAFVSKQSEFEAAEEIRNRSNARLYDQSKLAITVTEGRLSKQEEQFMGRWAKSIPFVAGSERAYVTFLNRMRADVFDSMAATLGKGGFVTVGEAKLIANFVNVSTGRGSLGPAEAAAVPLATAFFAPRYMVSRFQLIIGQPLFRGDRRVKSLIAKEYGRALMGIGTFYGLAYLFSDDDDKPTVEFDARSSEFGKMRWGNTRIDPLAGLSQTTVLITRLATGETKASTGEVVPIRGEGVPFNGLKTPEMIMRFLRGKLSPWLGSAFDILSGENVVGEEVTPLTVASRSVVPLSFGDIYAVLKNQGITRGAALSLLVLLGVGAQDYENTTPGGFAAKIAKHGKLSGRNKETKEEFDYTAEVSQIVAQARRLGMSEQELSAGLEEKLRKEGYKSDTITTWKRRLRSRLNAK